MLSPLCIPPSSSSLHDLAEARKQHGGQAWEGWEWKWWTRRAMITGWIHWLPTPSHTDCLADICCCLGICFSVALSVSVYLSACLCVCPVRLFVRLRLHVSVCWPVCLSCLFFSACFYDVASMYVRTLVCLLCSFPYFCHCRSVFCVKCVCVYWRLLFMHLFVYLCIRLSFFFICRV